MAAPREAEGEAWWTGLPGLTINRRSQAPAAGSAQVAQLVEHATENRSVGGSIPPLGTIGAHPRTLAIRLRCTEMACPSKFAWDHGVTLEMVSNIFAAPIGIIFKN
jgi:hypothetical protein